ncbi:MAG: hypothetical protein ACK53X_02845, partial [Holosporales bacterium]
MGKNKQKTPSQNPTELLSKAIDEGDIEYFKKLEPQNLKTFTRFFDYALQQEKWDIAMLLLQKKLSGRKKNLPELTQNIVKILEEHCPESSTVPQWLMDKGISTELFQTLLPYWLYTSDTNTESKQVTHQGQKSRENSQNNDPKNALNEIAISNSSFDAAHLLVNAATNEESHKYLPVLANNLIGLNSWKGTVNLGVLLDVDDKTFIKIFSAFLSATKYPIETKLNQLIGKINSMQDDNTKKLLDRMVQLVPNIFQENLFPRIIKGLPDNVGIFTTILEGTKKKYTPEDYEKMLQAAFQWRRLQIAQHLIAETNAPLVRWRGSLLSLPLKSQSEIRFVSTRTVLSKTLEQQWHTLPPQYSFTEPEEVLVPSLYQESYYKRRDIAKHLLKAGINNDVELRKTTLEQTAWVLLYKAIASMPLSIQPKYHETSGWGINGFINHLCNPIRDDPRTAVYLEQIVQQLTRKEKTSVSQLKVFKDDGRHFDLEAVKKRFEDVHQWITNQLDKITKSDTCLDEIEKKISQKSIRDCIREGVNGDSYLTLITLNTTEDIPWNKSTWLEKNTEYKELIKENGFDVSLSPDDQVMLVYKPPQPELNLYLRGNLVKIPPSCERLLEDYYLVENQDKFYNKNPLALPLTTGEFVVRMLATFLAAEAAEYNASVQPAIDLSLPTFHFTCVPSIGVPVEDNKNVQGMAKELKESTTTRFFNTNVHHELYSA